MLAVSLLLSSAAIAKVVAEGYDVNRELTQSFLEHIFDELESGTPFVQALRLSLNALYIQHKAQRAKYCKVAGHYFTRHAQAARKSKIPAHKRKQQSSKVRIRLEKNGQYGFKF